MYTYILNTFWGEYPVYSLIYKEKQEQHGNYIYSVFTQGSV